MCLFCLGSLIRTWGESPCRSVPEAVISCCSWTIHQCCNYAEQLTRDLGSIVGMVMLHHIRRWHAVGTPVADTKGQQCPIKSFSLWAQELLEQTWLITFKGPLARFFWRLLYTLSRCPYTESKVFFSHCESVPQRFLSKKASCPNVVLQKSCFSSASIGPKMFKMKLKALLLIFHSVRLMNVSDRCGLKLIWSLFRLELSWKDIHRFDINGSVTQHTIIF